LQSCPLDADARTHTFPRLLQIDTAEHGALWIAELPKVENRSSALNCFGHTQLAERPQPVCLHRDTGAGGLPSRVALDKIDLAALTVKCRSQSEPGNSTTND
jgi:hypothetical protein